MVSLAPTDDDISAAHIVAANRCTVSLYGVRFSMFAPSDPKLLTMILSYYDCTLSDFPLLVSSASWSLKLVYLRNPHPTC